MDGDGNDPLCILTDECEHVWSKKSASDAVGSASKCLFIAVHAPKNYCILYRLPIGLRPFLLDDQATILTAVTGDNRMKAESEALRTVQEEGHVTQQVKTMDQNLHFVFGVLLWLWPGCVSMKEQNRTDQKLLCGYFPAERDVCPMLVELGKRSTRIIFQLATGIGVKIARKLQWKAKGENASTTGAFFAFAFALT